LLVLLNLSSTYTIISIVTLVSKNFTEVKPNFKAGSWAEKKFLSDKALIISISLLSQQILKS